MAKKKKQTEGLNKAALELLKRNEPERTHFEEWVEKLEGKIPRDVLEKNLVRPAVISYRFLSDEDVASGKFLSPDDILNNRRWKDNFFNLYGPWGRGDKLDAVKLLTYSDPFNTLLLGIDLSRSKESILEEVKRSIDYHKERREGLQRRHKWLSKQDEIFQVWDMWEGYGQRRCFHLIARKLEIPESTVKARWQLAYEVIHGERFTKEQAKDDALKLCAKCKDQTKCYKTIGGVMEFIPCAAYAKLAGKEYSREKLYGNTDDIPIKKGRKKSREKKD